MVEKLYEEREEEDMHSIMAVMHYARLNYEERVREWW
jgi:hypothetical protein